MGYVVTVTQIYNERRLFYGGGAGAVPNDNFGSVASSPNTDRRGPRSRGMLLFLFSCMGDILVVFSYESHWRCLQLLVRDL